MGREMNDILCHNCHISLSKYFCQNIISLIKTSIIPATLFWTKFYLFYSLFVLALRDGGGKQRGAQTKHKG